MKYDRKEVIDMLLDDKTDIVVQWAISDPDSISNYVAEAENFDALDDDTLQNMYESAFAEEFDDE